MNPKDTIKHIADLCKTPDSMYATFQNILNLCKLQLESFTQFRLTRPGCYAPGTPGCTDVSARQGYYVKASTAEEAVSRLRNSSSSFLNYKFDVQIWDDGPDHGKIIAMSI